MTKDKRIVVLTNGWVFVGEYHSPTKTKPAYLEDASCVRRWGTDAGLGQLALKGPQEETQLDPCGVLLIDNPAAVLFHIPCQW